MATEWDYDGKFFLSDGLIQIWWNDKLSLKVNFHADPPVLKPDVIAWMNDHHVDYMPGSQFPVMWSFSSHDLREQFKELFMYSDSERSKMFYGKLLGLTFVQELHAQGAAHYSATDQNGAVFELYQTSNTMLVNRGLRLGFKGNGLPLSTRTAVDPDGNTIVIEGED